MADSKVDIKVNGVDNASKVLQQVKGQLDSLNRSATSMGSNFSSSSKNAVGGLKDVAGAVSLISPQMGQLISSGARLVKLFNTLKSGALAFGPIALAAGASIWAIKAAYDSTVEAGKKRAKQLEDETDAMLKQSKAARDLADDLKAIARHSSQKADLLAKLYDYSPVRKNEVEGQLMQVEYDSINASTQKLQQRIAKMEIELAGKQGLAKAQGINDDVRKAAEEAAKKLEADLDANREKFGSLNKELDILRLKIKLNQKEWDQMMTEEEMKPKLEAAKLWLAEAEAQEEVDEMRSKLIDRMNAEISAMKKSSLQKSVSQTTSGAKSTSLEEVNKINALLKNGLLKATATGYLTSQGDAMREAEARQKTMQFQNELLAEVKKIAQRHNVSQSSITVDIMDY